MRLQLVFEDRWAISVRVDPRLHEAIDLQRERALQDDMDEVFADRIASCISDSLAKCLDVDLQLPTASQVNYATAIARELGIALPADTLRYRGAAHEFIDRFGKAFQESRQWNRPSASE
jgi:hypothetical protein